MVALEDLSSPVCRERLATVEPTFKEDEGLRTLGFALAGRGSTFAAFARGLPPAVPVTDGGLVGLIFSLPLAG